MSLAQVPIKAASRARLADPAMPRPPPCCCCSTSLIPGDVLVSGDWKPAISDRRVRRLPITYHRYGVTSAEVTESKTEPPGRQGKQAFRRGWRSGHRGNPRKGESGNRAPPRFFLDGGKIDSGACIYPRTIDLKHVMGPGWNREFIFQGLIPIRALELSKWKIESELSRFR